MNLWLVFRWAGLSLEFLGAFDSPSAAELQCTDDSCWVGPCELNVLPPSAPEVWPGAYYPKAVT